MPGFKLTGTLRPPLAAGWPDPVSITWIDGRLRTGDQLLNNALRLEELREVDLVLPRPANNGPPYLESHGKALAWLQEFVLEPGAEAEGDLVPYDLLPTPDVRSGPLEDRRIVNP